MLDKKKLRQLNMYINCKSRKMPQKIDFDDTGLIVIGDNVNVKYLTDLYCK